MEAKTEVELNELLRLNKRFCILGKMLDSYRDQKKALRNVHCLIQKENQFILMSQLPDDKRPEKFPKSLLTTTDAETLLWRYRDLLVISKIMKGSKNAAALGKASRDLLAIVDAVSIDILGIEEQLLILKGKETGKQMASKIKEKAKSIASDVEEFLDNPGGFAEKPA